MKVEPYAMATRIAIAVTASWLKSRCVRRNASTSRWRPDIHAHSFPLKPRTNGQNRPIPGTNVKNALGTPNFTPQTQLSKKAPQFHPLISGGTGHTIRSRFALLTRFSDARGIAEASLPRCHDVWPSEMFVTTQYWSPSSDAWSAAKATEFVPWPRMANKFPLHDLRM